MTFAYFISEITGIVFRAVFFRTQLYYRLQQPLPSYKQIEISLINKLRELTFHLPIISHLFINYETIERAAANIHNTCKKYRTAHVFILFKKEKFLENIK